MITGAFFGQPDLSDQVTLEHVFDNPEDPGMLLYAPGDRVANGDLKAIQKRGVKLAKVGSDEVRAWEDEVRLLAGAAVSHQATPEMAGSPRTPEFYQRDLDAKDAEIAELKAKLDSKVETKEKRGPKEPPKTATPKADDKDNA